MNTPVSTTDQEHTLEAEDLKSTPATSESFCQRSAFYIKGIYRGLEQVNQMYVERLTPLCVSQPFPIILIHGDFHTSKIWLTKPDDKPGWASFFLNQGYCVFVMDLPGVGRSNFLTKVDYAANDFACKPSSLNTTFVEDELTAMENIEKRSRNEPFVKKGWAQASQHDKWPGTGQRGDPIFDSYFASLTSLSLNKTERQSLAQSALQSLLAKTGKAILVGEGSGCTVAWLATDVRPDLVAAVVAVEPVGPPFGSALYTNKYGTKVYTQYIQQQKGNRVYGLADIPLTYDPPIRDQGIFPIPEPALDVERVSKADGGGSCMLQKGFDNEVMILAADGKPLPGEQQPGRVRHLTNLKKVPHVIITGEASSHMLYDWATMLFMRQAGVHCTWLPLGERNIFGNGHLMFLETNSDEIAGVIHGDIRSMLSRPPHSPKRKSEEAQGGPKMQKKPKPEEAVS